MEIIDKNKGKRIVIDPISRVEGHGKVTLLLDENNRLQEARLHIVEFRGFEKFIEGRPYEEVAVIVQRLCGICPVSHHLAAAKAIDQLVGVNQLSPTAEKIRRLLHYGQVLQSHALHFFYLSSPDLLFGFETDLHRRNIIEVIKDFPDIGRQGIQLRKFGQDIIQAISGKKIHGVVAVPGGINRSLDIPQRDALRAQLPDILKKSKKAVAIARDLYLSNIDIHKNFGFIESSFLSLVDSKGALELYDGNIRIKDKAGKIFKDQLDDNRYFDYIQEEVRSWSYMKFPFLSELGIEKGWYRVGPLARVNNCAFISTPLAEQARKEFIQFHHGLAQAPLAYHWARMIELLHCAEQIENLLQDEDITGNELVVKGCPQEEGIGVIEAPRGTLFHHYKINEEGLIQKANLIVSTTQNNQAMNDSVREVAREYIDGQEITEGALNQIEVAIRAYDPCLSCATHAMGKMPLKVELFDHNGELLDTKIKSSV
ncbi:MAG: Ni/Fe hydrogenase subunit alpha [Pseudomonadales bacterium]|nr:Ni/Fe hydrogenase subunit alpha [Pseudomonadales bacterium]